MHQTIILVLFYVQHTAPMKRDLWVLLFLVFTSVTHISSILLQLQMILMNKTKRIQTRRPCKTTTEYLIWDVNSDSAPRLILHADTATCWVLKVTFRHMCRTGSRAAVQRVQHVAGAGRNTPGPPYIKAHLPPQVFPLTVLRPPLRTMCLFYCASWNGHELLRSDFILIRCAAPDRVHEDNNLFNRLRRTFSSGDVVTATSFAAAPPGGHRAAPWESLPPLPRDAFNKCSVIAS